MQDDLKGFYSKYNIVLAKSVPFGFKKNHRRKCWKYKLEIKSKNESDLLKFNTTDKKELSCLQKITFYLFSFHFVDSFYLFINVQNGKDQPG